MNTAAWSPDGSRLVTAGWGRTARIWDVSVDLRSLAEWSAFVDEQCPYALVNGVLLARMPPVAPSRDEALPAVTAKALSMIPTTSPVMLRRGLRDAPAPEQMTS